MNKGRYHFWYRLIFIVHIEDAITVY